MDTRTFAGLLAASPPANIHRQYIRQWAVCPSNVHRQVVRSQHLLLGKEVFAWNSNGSPKGDQTTSIVISVAFRSCGIPVALLKELAPAVPKT